MFGSPAGKEQRCDLVTVGLWRPWVPDAVFEKMRAEIESKLCYKPLVNNGMRHLFDSVDQSWL
jgi:hypothetical protein